MNTNTPLPTPAPVSTSVPSPWDVSQPAPALSVTESPFADQLPARATIHTDFFEFFTLSMMAIVGVVVGVIAWGHAMIIPTFLHHLQLNGIIAGITVYGVFRVYKNNASLYRTARYVKRIQDMEQNPAATEADIARLVKELHGPGSMLDIQNTEMALRRMLKSGFFVITDNDSRLIKSKIGARVRYRYNHIAFFAGILISFGLLGTFVGLIATVASVGEQMGNISRSLAAGEQMNVIDLIVGISKPMEGMGTAFGASLFGLAGSMLLGGLNHVAGHAQDHFMENLSRWLDDRIPALKGKTADKTAEKTGQHAAEVTGKTMSLETGTFMVLAEDTHKQLRAIGGFMAELAKTLERQQASTANLQQMHEQNAQQIAALQTTLGQLPAVGQHIMQSLGQQQNAQAAHFGKLLETLATLPHAGDKLGQQLGGELKEWRAATGRQLEQQMKLEAQLSASMQNIATTLQQMKPTEAHVSNAAPLGATTAAPEAKRGLFGFGK